MPDGIVMDVVDMSHKIFFVVDYVFQEASLPDAAFSMSAASGRNARIQLAGGLAPSNSLRSTTQALGVSPFNLTLTERISRRSLSGMPGKPRIEYSGLCTTYWGGSSHLLMIVTLQLSRWPSPLRERLCRNHQLWGLNCTGVLW